MQILRIMQYPLEYGGLQLHVRKLSMALDRLGCNQYFVTPKRRKIIDPNISFPFEIKESFLSISKMNCFISVPVLCFLAVLMIKKYKIEIIHAHHDFLIGVVGFLAKIITRKSLVISLHGFGHEYIKKWDPRCLILKLIFSYADFLVSMTDYSIENEIKKISEDLVIKTRLILSGVDKNSYLSKREALRNTFNFFKNEKIVVFAAALEERKGIIDLINSIPKVIKNQKAVKFLILGDGRLRSKIENVIKEKKISEYIRILGWAPHDSVLKIFAASDVFVFPSIKEGQGSSLREAIVSNLAVIGTRVGGIPEIVENGKNGYLINSNSPDEISKALIKIINNELDQSTIRETNEKISNRISYEKEAFDHLELYNEILNKN